MYHSLKKAVKSILPKKLLFNYEDELRRTLTPFYKGDDHECNVCETRLKKFVSLENGDKICPICGSISRTRRLYKLLNDEYLKDGMSFLDFSPFRILYKKWKKRKDIQYFSSDFADDFLSDYRFDITNIDSNAESFDLIVCYHILEHIIDDEKAMSELYRVLKANGTALIQTPFKEGDIYEDYSITSDKGRLKHFGQEDHVRIYSILGLEARLKAAGFLVDVVRFSGDSYFGFAENEVVLVCTKK